MIRHSTGLQPRSFSPAPSRAFNLKEIDTPEEAMLMPGADLWAGLVLGPLAGRVSVTVGDQHLEYETRPAPGKLTYTGKMNGEPFTLVGLAARPQGIQVTGDTPGGAIDSLRRGGGGGFGLDGQAGSVRFSQLLALDRSGGTSGNLAYLAGTIGEVEFEARARKGEDDTVEVSGRLGALPVRQTISLGDNEEWIIQGTLGEHHFTEVIERY